MRIPLKSLASGFSMPVFGIGTWQMGGRQEHDAGNDDARDIAAIQEAIRLGITHIDTAEIYAAGYAEKLLGKAIRDFDRSKLFLVSKVSGEHLTYDQILASCKASLQRVGTDYFDLYLIHRPSTTVPLQETMRAMDELKQKGLIRNIGVSNFLKERVAKAQSLTKNKIVVNQVHYNLMYREPEVTGLLRYCQEKDIFLMAWRPVEKGLLTASGIPVLDTLCKKYQKTPAQIAINWLIAQDHVITLAKTSNMHHLKENLDAIPWTMDREDIELLRKEFPGQQARSNAVPLS